MNRLFYAPKHTRLDGIGRESLVGFQATLNTLQNTSNTNNGKNSPTYWEGGRRLISRYTAECRRILARKIAAKTPSPICSCSRCCASWTASCRHWTENSRNRLHRTVSPLGSTTTVCSLSADFFSPKRMDRYQNRIMSHLIVLHGFGIWYSLVSFKYSVVDNLSEIEMNIFCFISIYTPINLDGGVTVVRMFVHFARELCRRRSCTAAIRRTLYTENSVII